MRSDIHDATELKAFATDTLKHFGALIQEGEREDCFEAVLPGKLAESLATEDYVRVGKGNGTMPLLYGSPLLERLIRLAGQDRMVITRKWIPPTLKKEGWIERVGDTFAWMNATGRVVSAEPAKSAYWIFHLAYAARSDEVHKGFCSLALHGKTLNAPPRFFENRDLEDVLHASLPALDEELRLFEGEKTMARLAQRLESLAPRHIGVDLQRFVLSREGRLQRDLQKLKEFFQMQEQEMKKLLKRKGQNEKTLRMREEKLAGLPRERKAKETDLLQKYGIRIEMDCRLAIKLLTTVVEVTFELRRRKQTRTLTLTWNPFTKELDPLVCEGCGDNIYAVITCDLPHLLCRHCGAGGARCPACQN